MKKTLKAALGGATLAAFFFLVITHFTACKASAGSTQRMVIPVPIWGNDTSNAGNSPGSGGLGGKPLYIRNPVFWPGGTVLVFTCVNKICANLPGSPNSGAAPGSPTILFEMKIPYDVPPNTEMSVSFRPAPGTK
jgi:hypothetical protein